MFKNAEEETKKYLTDLLRKEENIIEQRFLEFYKKYKIQPFPISFKDSKEDFLLLLNYNNKLGIYFNDIEEFFGICRIKDNVCYDNSEFYDSLNPTIQKLFEFYL